MKIKTNIKRFMMTLSLAIMTLAASAQNEAINNETILTLLKEGFSSEEIIGAIENSTERTIQYSIDYMRQLKRLPSKTLVMKAYSGGTPQTEASPRRCIVPSSRKSLRDLTLELSLRWVLVPCS